jgi:hypothetical protein
MRKRERMSERFCPPAHPLPLPELHIYNLLKFEGRGRGRG